MQILASGSPARKTLNGSSVARAPRAHRLSLNRVRMNIPSSGPAVLDPEGVDGNIHTNWLGLCRNRAQAASWGCGISVMSSAGSVYQNRASVILLRLPLLLPLPSLPDPSSIPIPLILMILPLFTPIPLTQAPALAP